MTEFYLGALSSIAVAAVFYVWGATLRRKVPLFLRFCIPPAVLGGLTVSILVFILRMTLGVNVNFNIGFQYPMMLVFFATVGLGGSLKLIKTGGKLMAVYLLACWAISLIQSVTGVALAKLLGVHSLIGLMAGSVSLSGGHANAAAFGALGGAFGVEGAHAVALASATYGLMTGALVGGPVAARLIRKHGLAKEALNRKHNAAIGHDDSFSGSIDGFGLFKMVALVAVITALGDKMAGALNVYARYVRGWDAFYIPGYVCSMFIAVVVRNLNDFCGLIKLDRQGINLIASVSLGFFLTMGMMSLRLWHLSGLGFALTVMLAAHTVIIVAFTDFAVFPLLGGDFDAAVMCSGFIGHGMGATPNAISNMNSVADRFGTTSEKAFLIVPLCSAFLVDLFVVPQILWFITYFGS